MNCRRSAATSSAHAALQSQLQPQGLLPETDGGHKNFLSLFGLLFQDCAHLWRTLGLCVSCGVCDACSSLSGWIRLRRLRVQGPAVQIRHREYGLECPKIMFVRE